MRKKLLTILLSIVVILTSTVTVFADISTVADVLSLSKTSFPTTYADGWRNNENDSYRIYIENNGFALYDSTNTNQVYFSTGFSVFLNNNNYEVWLDTTCITFAIEEGCLTSIVISDTVLDPTHPVLGTYSAPKTIADILPTDFPTSSSTTAPVNAWINEKGISMFINEGMYPSLYCGSGSLALMNQIVGKDGDNYSVTGDGVTVNFVMNDNKLVNINVKGIPDPYGDYNGTYTAPTPIENVDLSFVGEGWKDKTLGEAKSTLEAFTGNRYVIASGDSQFFVKKDEGGYTELTDDSATFVSGKTYVLNTFLIAEDKYYFAGVDDDPNNTKNYSGTTIPDVPKVKVKAVASGTSGSVIVAKTSKYLMFQFEFEVTEPVDYEIIQGIKAVIDANGGKDYSYFTSDAPFSKFKEVQVDGTAIAKGTDYTVSEGSTKVTLKTSYINQLELGEHTLTIVSFDGEASTTFTIVRNPKPSPSPNPGYVVPNTGVN